jgi:hypothetical protein
VAYLNSVPNLGMKYVRVGEVSSVQGKGVLTFSIPGFEPTAKSFSAVDVVHNAANDYTWAGSSKMVGEAAFFRKPEGMAGYMDYGTRLYSLHPLAPGLGIVLKHKMSKLPGKCAVADGPTSSIACQEDDCGAAIVDVLILTTAGADTYLNDTYGTFGAFYVWWNTGLTNLALNLSGVPNKRVRNHIHSPIFTPATALSGDIVNDRDNLLQDQGLQTLRNLYRADIVVVLTDQSYVVNDNPTFGLVNTLDPAVGNKVCIVEAQFLSDPRFTFAHEVAHQFGCGHADANNGALDECSHAKVLDFGDEVTRPTILGPTNDTLPGGPMPRIFHYSNPDVSFGTVPTGDAGYRDNARTMRGTMCQVAAMQQPSSEMGAFIVGSQSNLCLLNGTVVPITYTSTVFAPAPGLPGQGPYAYEWRWSEDGFFNPGFYLGNTPTIPITQVLACPQFFIRLKVTASDGTITTHTRRITTNLCTSCLSQSLSQPTESGVESVEINVFPNPAEGYLQIESPRALQSVALWDMTGRQVLRSETAVAPHEGIRLDLSGLPAGVYFLSAQTPAETLVRKVILQSSTSK